MSTLQDDGLVQLMRQAGMPVTRQNWIDLAWGNEIPAPWTSEEESELPEELQDWSKVLVEGA